jgi:hypothetical protein
LSPNTPLWAPGNLLFVSSEYDAGSKVVRLERNGLVIKAADVWESTDCACIMPMRFVWMALSISLWRAVDLATGKIHWQQRAVSKATFVWADKKLITLAGSGRCADARAAVTAGIQGPGESGIDDQPGVDVPGAGGVHALSS